MLQAILLAGIVAAPLGSAVPEQERGENPLQFSLTFKWDSSHAKQ